MIPKLSAYARDRLAQMANQALGTTAAEYVKGVSIDEGDGYLTVNLDGVLPNALEKGFSAFDIKTAMLAKATKFSKSGTPYVDVPFRFGLKSTTTVQSMGPSAAKMVQSALRSKQRELKRAGASATEVATARVRLAQKTPGKEFTRDLQFGTKTVTTQVSHKQGITDSMTRTAKMVGSRAVGSYQTFRRISGNSDSAAWWHPGFKGVRLLPKLRSEIQSVAKDMFKAELRAKGVKL